MAGRETGPPRGLTGHFKRIPAWGREQAPSGTDGTDRGPAGLYREAVAEHSPVGYRRYGQRGCLESGIGYSVTDTGSTYRRSSP
jgi:hypothetical protein